MHQDLSLPENGGGFSVGWYGNQDQAGAEEYGSSVFPTLVTSVFPMEMAGSSEVSLERSLAASRNHREAERRRRERIKSHLDRLRNLLACDSKIDKATLLAKAVEHVRYLKQRTAEIAEIEHFPTETDEVSVYPTHVPTANGHRSIIKASLCCEDRSDLLPELIETVKSLRLKTLKAEIATMGGRVRNVLVVAGEEEDGEEQNSGGEVAAFLRDALKAVMDRAGPVPEQSKDSKRSRTDLDGTRVAII